MTVRAPVYGGSLTAWSLVALAVGLLLGIGLDGSSPLVAALREGVAPVGHLWIRGLQMTVLPLVITQVLAAITGLGEGGGRAVGALGGRALGLFVVLLAVAGLFTVAVAPPLIALYPVAPETAAALRAGTTIPASALEAASAPGGGPGSWVVGLLPANVFQALTRGEILPILLFTVLVGLAANHLPAETRDPLRNLVRAAAGLMLIVVRWILVATPVGVFVLAFELSLGAGVHAAGFLIAFVVVVSGLLVLFTILLYPVTVAAGRTTFRDFARAVAPAQLVAVSTRSSLASLPALVEGGGTHLRLPASATGFVLPLSVSVFKVNRTVSSTAKLLFLAYVFGVPMGAGAIATFIVTVILLSFTSVGVPGGGAAFRTLPAYLAAGLPIEGVVIVEAVDMIPDIFKTLTNVTGDLSAATILSRRERRSPALAGVEAAAPVAAGPVGAGEVS